VTAIDADSLREEVAQRIATLTATQVRRVTARVEGQSLATIAQAEGCSIQSVHESLRAPKVQQAFDIMGRSLAAVDPESGKTVDFVLTLLANVWDIASGATRAVAVGDRIEMVPDYPTRLAASAKLLSLATPSKTYPETALKDSAA